MLLGLYFLGLSYLLVYVGAISILFLFILMLINVRISELLTDTKNSVFLAILAVLGFNLPVDQALPYGVSIADLISSYSISSVLNLLDESLRLNSSNFGFNLSKTIIDSVYSIEIANVTSKWWDGALIEISHIIGIGNGLYTNYFVFLAVTSLILLLAMVGAIVITISKSPATDVTDQDKAYSFISKPL